jgi:hypothetical protein
MQITIITPIWRLQYLHQVAESIPEGYRWIVVFGYQIPVEINLPPNAECYAIASHSGIDKRNLGIELVNSGHLYFLDDDTIIHPDFYKLADLPSEYDFVHFNQILPTGEKRIGGKVKCCHIDTGSFIVSRGLLGDLRWQKHETPDGIMAETLFERAKKPLYLDQDLSIYNALR